ncbi:MAG: iron(III) transport system ATP-binding protein [Clostridiales bacterium]|jgi:iron(III) transport system ATP-binding protein|nr:iron(III) transport system ATP-binding protein [Clostridiales bacterium]MDN5298380.1 iron(III) transport system ATP-binding protein [Clostridiales bacterium]
MKIVLKNIQKTYGDKIAVNIPALQIEHAQFTTLLGPSGCGKTTLLRMIAGLEMPDCGEIVIGETCVYASEQNVWVPPENRKLGMVFQDFALWPHMTVYENVAFGLRATRRFHQLDERVRHALQSVRLDGYEKRYPHQLSGGQQQRVAFARALAVQSEVILLDEPLSALDAILRDEMRLELMQLVKSNHMTALFVTHDQTEAMTMSDSIVVMNDGNVLQQGKPETIYQRPAHTFVGSFIGKSNWLGNRHRMIRPETIAWQPKAHFENVSGTVTNVAYTGDRYEIYVDVKPFGQWLCYHDERKTIGETVQLYIPMTHVYEFKKEQ